MLPPSTHHTADRQNLMKSALPFDRVWHLSLLLLTTVLLGGCDFFRGPDEGFDGDWEPDFEESKGETNERVSPLDEEDAGELHEEIDGRTISTRRPSDILADTATLKVVTGEYVEEGKESSTFRSYLDTEGSRPEMIVEETESSTRSYFFTDGLLFYYTEAAHDGSFDLTVEFDDLGDVRGSQKLRNGKRVPARSDDYAEIVERAMELIRAESQ